MARCWQNGMGACGLKPVLLPQPLPKGMFSLKRASANASTRRRDVTKRVLYIVAGLLVLWCVVYFIPVGEVGAAEEAAAPADENASPVGGTSISLWTPGNIAALMLLAGGAALALYLQKRREKSAGGVASLQSLETLQLAPNQEVRLVRCGKDILLLGVTSGQITLLSTYDADDLPAFSRESGEQNASPIEGDGAVSGTPRPNFATMLEQVAGRKLRNSNDAGSPYA